LDPLGRRVSPASVPRYLTGRPSRRKRPRYPADPPRTEEIIAVMRCCGDGLHGDRARGLIAVLWRAGLRIQEALNLNELDLDRRRGSVLVRRGKGGRRREVGMDHWGFEQLEPWLRAREQMPVGPLFCVIDGHTRGRAWHPSAARDVLRGRAAQAGVRRRFAPHQLRHAHAIELTKVALFTERSVDDMMDIYAEFETRQGKGSTERELAELTKVAALTGRSPNEVIKVYDQIDSGSPGWAGRDRLAELTKIALLTNSSPKTVYFRFTEINAKKKGWGTKDHRVMELTKLSLLGKRTAEDVVRTFNKLAALDGGKDSKSALTFSLLSGELLQDSVFGNNVDECSGGYARLILSIDSYSSGET